MNLNQQINWYNWFLVSRSFIHESFINEFFIVIKHKQEQNYSIQMFDFIHYKLNI
jgi:hypothetical protein